MTGVALTIIDDPSDRDIGELDDRINAFNFMASGINDARFLSIMLRNEEGALFAGLHGYSWGGYCEIRLLWVDEQRRGSGLGSALMAAAEAEAITRGCDRILLTTHSFQAAGFYTRRGFRRVAEVAGCPRGHSHLTMVKPIRN